MLNFGGPRRVGSPEGWGAPKGGAQKGGAQKGGGPKPRGAPKGGGPKPRGAPKGGAQKGGAPKGGGGAQNFALFFFLRHNFHSFFSLLGSFRGILVVFEAPGP